MEISCSNCNSTFAIPDDRIPEARKFRLNCPKCREPIVVDQDQDQEKVVAPEHFPHDAVVAFVYVTDPALAAGIAVKLKEMGIYISTSTAIHEALDKVRINYYNVLILEESDNSRSILSLVRKWNGLRRREANIVLVGSSCQSLHANDAFFRGVNAVIGARDNDRVGHFLELALGEYKNYIEPWSIAAEKLRLNG